MIWRKGKAVVFRVACADADEVYLAGDFNRWSIPGVAMRRVAPGWWEVQQILPPGPQRVGYFALRWRTASAEPTDDDEAPDHRRKTIDASWLTEYETICIQEPMVSAEPIS
jgi:1,4-alpha-glucan branching enzyme